MGKWDYMDMLGLKFKLFLVIFRRRKWEDIKRNRAEYRVEYRHLHKEGGREGEG